MTGVVKHKQFGKYLLSVAVKLSSDITAMLAHKKYKGGMGKPGHSNNRLTMRKARKH